MNLGRFLLLWKMKISLNIQASWTECLYLCIFLARTGSCWCPGPAVLTTPAWSNQRPVFRSRDQSGPMRTQCYLWPSPCPAQAQLHPERRSWSQRRDSVGAGGCHPPSPPPSGPTYLLLLSQGHEKIKILQIFQGIKQISKVFGLT